MNNNSEILLYQTEDRQTKIDVRLEKEIGWLSLATKQNVSPHIKNIYEKSELYEISAIQDYLTVETEGKRKTYAEAKEFLQQIQELP